MASAAMEQAPGLAWNEIGRAAPEDECWVAWVALEDGGGAFYRCLVTQGGAALVTIDLHRPGSPQPQRLHSGQRSLPPDDQASARCIGELLADADRAAWITLTEAPGLPGRLNPAGP